MPKFTTSEQKSTYTQDLMKRSGLNFDEANIISDIYAEGEFRPAEGQLRRALSMNTRFGDIQSVEKNYGGLQGLADFWDRGGKGKMTDVPFTSTPSGGRTGGVSLMLPETPLTGITPRDDLNNQLGQETYGNPAFQKQYPGAQGAMEQSPTANAGTASRFQQGFNSAQMAGMGATTSPETGAVTAPGTAMPGGEATGASGTPATPTGGLTSINIITKL